MDIILGWLHQGLSAIVPFVVLLGILIFVHELGHFLVARWCGVRVEVFSLGFGKKIFSHKRGDTTYCVSIVPLGGYVKMFGEQPGAEIPEDQKKYSFTHKHVMQRIAVVLAGPLMNFFFAILLFFALALIGEEMQKPLLGDIETNSAAYNAGFRSGDLIKAVNGKNLITFDEFNKQLTENKNHQILVTVDREGVPVTFPTEVTTKPNPNILSTTDLVGDIPGLNLMAKGTLVGVPTTSPLYQAGLRTGDQILAINGQPVKYWRDLDKVLNSIPSSAALTLDIARFTDDKFEATDKMSLTFAGGRVPSYSIDTLGISNSDVYLAKIERNSPAAQAGFQAFDKILAIDGKPIQVWEDIVQTIKNYDGKSENLKFDILRGDQKMSFDIKPQMTTQTSQMGAEDKRYTIGIRPLVSFADFETVVVKSDNPGTALVRGITRTWDVSVMMAMSFVRLFENKISAKNIGGVISIGQAASETFKLGIDKFLQMMALISVNLFILNLLPIPVLDGGHLVFYLIEAAKGSPLSIKKMEMAQQVGLVLLMSLMVFALFNDITRIFFN
jgi:regulator of sigma E protease